MSPEEFQLLRDLIHQRCGLNVPEHLRYLMERRLGPRLEALGLDSFADYRRFLQSDARREAELERAIEALATHETYFFREPHQLEAFSREILPALHQRNRSLRRLRIWSA